MMDAVNNFPSSLINAYAISISVNRIICYCEYLYFIETFKEFISIISNRRTRSDYRPTGSEGKLNRREIIKRRKIMQFYILFSDTLSLSSCLNRSDGS